MTRQESDAIRIARQHFDAGRLAEAETICRQTLQINPNDAEALYLLGMIAGRAGHLQDAAGLFSRAAQFQPNVGAIHAGLGLAMMEMARFPEAARAYHQAARLMPNDFGVWHNLGVIYERTGRLRDAAQSFQRAIALAPQHALARLNLGTILRDLGRMDEALVELRRAVEFDPNLADAHMVLAWVLLLTGNFALGLPQYEWRWQCPGFKWPNLPQPLWDGSNLTGRTILLHAEQGLGDTIQFVRYAAPLAAGGARVIVLAPKSLVPLIATAPGVSNAADRAIELGKFDVWSPMASLPLRFGTNLAAIPSDVPYLRADPQRVAIWGQRLKADREGFKVGLCWGGNRANVINVNRSIDLPMLAPLDKVPGICFYSLQLGDAAAQVRLTASPKVIDHTSFIHDFADTAALMMHLDLVISVDTSVAHLAGALGRKVWTLLHFAPDWRWLLDRPDSPWYPTMRLFRKRPEGSWEPVVREVAAQLALGR